MLFSTPCLTSKNIWTRLRKGGQRVKHTKYESEPEGIPESTHYPSEPLYVQPRTLSKILKKHNYYDITTPPKGIRLLKIRLLRILPNRSDNLLACELRTVQLDHTQTPSYDALSYTWGPTTQDQINDGMDDKRNCLIMCDGKRLRVTKNLLNCLTQLEKNHYHRYLWIDAICINQNNELERGLQVSIMGDIYSLAETVIVWLGVDDESTELAHELTNKPALLEQGVLPEHWKALALLFKRSWFMRTWVVQELVLARKTTVLCGKFAFKWEGIVDASHFMAKRTSANMFKDSNSHSYKNPAKLEAIRRDRENKKESAGMGTILLRNLIRCRTYEASKDHDKVYSLLGLLNCRPQDLPKTLHPNYHTSVSKLYTDVTKYILRTTDDLHVLAHAEGDEFRHVTGLPTWVPDWSVKENVGLRITDERYKAAGELPCFKEIRDGNTLVLRGFKLDTISRIGVTKAVVNETKSCSDWLNILDELEREYPGRDHKDALWRTALVDTDPSETVPIKRPWENSFDVWMQLCGYEPSDEEKRRAIEFETSFTHSLNLRLFRTIGGHLGCGTISCRSGDSIWIVQGSRVPLILRPTQRGNKTTYNLVGGTYLHGFMQGEALGGREFMKISLI